MKKPPEHKIPRDKYIHCQGAAVLEFHVYLTETIGTKNVPFTLSDWA